MTAKGLTEVQACLVAGVNFNTFNSAKQRNPDFAHALKVAKVVFLDRALTRILAGERNWQRLAWLLERRHREQFSRSVSRVDQGMENAGFVLTAEAQAQLAAIAKQGILPPS